MIQWDLDVLKYIHTNSDTNRARPYSFEASKSKAFSSVQSIHDKILNGSVDLAHTNLYNENTKFYLTIYKPIKLSFQEQNLLLQCSG